jgi:adenosylcobinamide-phosphate synthase
MLGYRTPELEWFGKTSARTDDLLNLVPARVTALLLVAAAAVVPGVSAGRAQRIARQDARRTASPNAGWPMAAMAGALGVRLDKRVDRPRSDAHSGPRRARRVYVLHAAGRAPTVGDLARARCVAWAAAALGLAFVVPGRRARAGRVA